MGERAPAAKRDLIADPSYELTRILARAARNDGVKVLLSGQGGDELFGGYRRHQVARLLEHLHFRGAQWVTRMLVALLPRPTPLLAREYAVRIATALDERDPSGATCGFAPIRPQLRERGSSAPPRPRSATTPSGNAMRRSTPSCPRASRCCAARCRRT